MSTIACHEVMDRLDEHLDGILEGESSKAVHEHLAGCSSCRAELETAREIRAAARSLPRSIDPDRDLWPGIETRIEEQRVVRGSFLRHRSRSVLRLASAAAVLVAAMTIAYQTGLERARTRTVVAPAPGSGLQMAVHADVESDLVRVRDDLMARLNQRQDELSDETWTVVMDNLQVIDSAITRIETAIQDDPNNGGLSRRLALAYRQQIDLLQRATRMPAEI